ncbi:UNVERIFIED_CONTAM: hypothetical protein FKN15_038947 [Acipenser sinensis]
MIGYDVGFYGGSDMGFGTEKDYIIDLWGKVAQTACMSACKHLSTSLLQLLLESEVKQISMGALQQFNIDVKECEHMSSDLHMPDFTFQEARLAGSGSGEA